ncbi:MAG: hypothetical protein JJU29_21980 [Verrucomicrobia bacterium]|nr:hypothetical protein [Verrucomicrobiota bacterium]MCH8512213.1 hypothetical protein [Kiritimatiellia bacterium]
MKTIALLLTFAFATVLPLHADTAIAGYASDSPMARVARELDMGGPQFQLSDGAYQWASISGFFDFIPMFFSMGLAADPTMDVPPNLGENLQKLPDLLGLNQILVSGESTVALPGGGYLSRRITLLEPEASGLIWQLHGKSFRLEEELRKLPPTTAAMLRVGFNAPEAVRRSIQLAREFGVPEEALADVVKVMSENEELSQAILGALDQGLTLAFSLNADVQWPLPFPGMEPIPELGIVLMIPDADEHLLPRILELFEESVPMPLVPLQIGGVEAMTLPIPLPMPSPLALTLAHLDGRIAITTSTALMESLVQRRAGEGEAPLLARLAPGLPEEAVGAWISNQEFQKLISKIAVGAMEMNPAQSEMPPEATAMVQVWMQTIAEVYNINMITEARGDLRQTVLLHSHPIAGGFPNQTQLVAGPMVVGLMAAIALPGFTRARQSAQRNACINNLRQIDAAKDQWAIENNKRDGDVVIAVDILEYFRDNALPVCPAGGAYELGTIGEAPSCSLGETLEGHALPGGW